MQIRFEVVDASASLSDKDCGRVRAHTLILENRISATTATKIIVDANTAKWVTLVVFVPVHGYVTSCEIGSFYETTGH